MLRALPGPGDVRFGERITEEDDFVAAFILAANLHERGLHSDFQDGADRSVDETRAWAQSTGISAKNDADAWHDEGSVTGGAIAVARIDQSRRDAHGAAIKSQPRAHGVEPSGGFVQQRRPRRVKPQAAIPDAFLKHPNMLDSRGMRERFVESNRG